MKIIISGGGNVGSMLARRLIADEHNVTIIEKNNSFLKHIKNSLDALVINGDGTDVLTLQEAGIQNASIFLAVTNNDHINLVSCLLAKKLNNNGIFIIGKLEDTNPFFNNESPIAPKEFGIDMLIDPGQLSITKLESMLEFPSAVEIVDYRDNQFLLAAIRINPESPLVGKHLLQSSQKIKELAKIKITAIARDDETIIPNGATTIHEDDIIYATGKNGDIKKLLKNCFLPPLNTKKIIVIGAKTRGAEIADHFSKQGKKVTIIDSDIQRCVELSKKMTRPLIIHGSATYEDTTHETNMEGAFVIAASDDDEYNVLCAVSAKKDGALKTVCMVRNSDIVSTVKRLPGIDAVFSPHALAVGEIIHICRQDNIISAAFLSDIQAETIEFKVSKKSPILNKKLSEITFPDGMVIGAVERANNLFIPVGNDTLNPDDKVTIFTLPKTAKTLKKLLIKQYFGNQK